MSEIVITRNDQGSIVETNRDDVIIFRLEENISTGYGWEPEAVDSSVLELIESTYTEAPGMAMGRSGTRILHFVARSPGSQDIHLRLRRPWDPPGRALDHLEVTIHVR